MGTEAPVELELHERLNDDCNFRSLSVRHIDITERGSTQIVL
ncbi:MAG: hypothetical protein QXK14_04835 [Acidilobaceae archaeon]